MRLTTPLTAGLICLCAAGAATAQTAPLDHADVAVEVDSGAVVNELEDRNAAWATVVEAPDASWIRLRFDQTVLGTPPPGGKPTVLRVTSLLDGARQHLDAGALRQWRYTSAYFNGEAVRLEIVADPGAEPSRVVLSSVLAGPPGGALATICGFTDDRMPSDDPRAARMLPVGCTGWLISDASNCFLSAGHCASGLEVAQFNVPLSDPSDGQINHPGPEDQYPVDLTSLQSVSGGTGNDWAYFGCFENTETGLTAFEAQGMAFDLAGSPPPVAGQTIRITGYGVDASPFEWNQIQQTHTGPYALLDGSQIEYEVDTQGGNSGSPVINEDTGLAIGIHTHGGCDQTGGANIGTGSNNGGLQTALAQPEGVCVPAPPLSFSFPDGLPDLLNPAGDTIRVVVSGANGGTPEPGTGALHYDAGLGPVTVAMEEIEPNVYDAVFPFLDCGTVVSYYFSAAADDGEIVTNPLFAPAQAYTAIGAVSLTDLFADDFEGDLGWDVVNAGITDGRWERSDPSLNSGCVRGNPPSDADGSGLCYITDNDLTDCNSDVDNGSTLLASPALDASGGMVFITYQRWYDNTGAGAGGNPFQDIFVVEVSDDDGASWVELETVGPGGDEVQGGWFQKTFFVEDFVEPTGQFRIRFVASDTDPQSVVEAGVDDVRLVRFECLAPSCPWDCADGDGVVGLTDFLDLLAEWGLMTDCDVDGGGVGLSDFLDLLANWGPCP